MDDEISEELEAAELFLLMVSPDFIASNYCVEREMQRALERHEAGMAQVVPIIVEPCDWAAMPQLRRLKAVPKDGLPISEWTNANTAYLDVIQEIRRIVDAGVSNALDSTADETEPASTQQVAPRYRVQRDFDEIDHSEYRDAAFTAIKNYFKLAIAEIDAVEGLRGPICRPWRELLWQHRCQSWPAAWNGAYHSALPKRGVRFGRHLFFFH